MYYKKKLNYLVPNKSETMSNENVFVVILGETPAKRYPVTFSFKHKKEDPRITKELVDQIAATFYGALRKQVDTRFPANIIAFAEVGSAVTAERGGSFEYAEMDGTICDYEARRITRALKKQIYARQGW